MSEELDFSDDEPENGYEWEMLNSPDGSSISPQLPGLRALEYTIINGKPVLGGFALDRYGIWVSESLAAGISSWTEVSTKEEDLMSFGSDRERLINGSKISREGLLQFEHIALIAWGLNAYYRDMTDIDLWPSDLLRAGSSGFNSDTLAFLTGVPVYPFLSCPYAYSNNEGGGIIYNHRRIRQHIASIRDAAFRIRASIPSDDVLFQFVDLLANWPNTAVVYPPEVQVAEANEFHRRLDETWLVPVSPGDLFISMPMETYPDRAAGVLGRVEEFQDWIQDVIESTGMPPWKVYPEFKVAVVVGPSDVGIDPNNINRYGKEAARLLGSNDTSVDVILAELLLTSGRASIPPMSAKNYPGNRKIEGRRSALWVNIIEESMKEVDKALETSFGGIFATKGNGPAKFARSLSLLISHEEAHAHIPLSDIDLEELKAACVQVLGVLGVTNKNGDANGPITDEEKEIIIRALGHSVRYELNYRKSKGTDRESSARVYHQSETIFMNYLKHTGVLMGAEDGWIDFNRFKGGVSALLDDILKIATGEISATKFRQEYFDEDIWEDIIGV